MARGKTRQNKATVPINSRKYEITWIYTTDPEEWTLNPAWLYQGLSAATKAFITSRLAQDAPAYEKWLDTMEKLKAFSKMQGHAEPSAEMLNTFLTLARAQGEKLIAELNTHFEISESDFKVDDPAMIAGANKAQDSDDDEAFVEAQLRATGPSIAKVILEGGE